MKSLANDSKKLIPQQSDICECGRPNPIELISKLAITIDPFARKCFDA